MGKTALARAIAKSTMSYVFPTLNALNDLAERGTHEAMADWVTKVGTVPGPSARPSNGWAPPRLDAVSKKAVDLEAARLEAHEEGFCAGYLAGQKAGTQRGLAEGRRDGREEGRAEVFEAERASLEAFQEALEGVVAQVGPAVEAWQAAIEARATELAMGAVRALLAAELATQRPDALGIVREALGHAEGAIHATIRLSPFDRAALAERKDEIVQACAGLRGVELVDDRSIEGGCIVETEQGLVDATFATRLALMDAA